MARFYEGIGFKLFASLLTIATVLLLIGGLTFYNQSITILENQILSSLSNTASLQKIRVTDAIASEIVKIVSFTQRPLLLNYIHNYLGGDDTAIANITYSAETTLEESYFEDIYLLNDRGKIFYATSSDTLPTLEEQDTLFNHGVDKTRLFIQDFGDGAKIYVCGPMILNGQFLGVAVFKKDTQALGFITNVTCSYHSSEETVLAYRGLNGEAVFFSELKFGNGTTIVYPDELKVPMIKALRGEEAILNDAVDYRGVPVLAATRYIESADIGLVTKIDLSEAYAPIYEVRNRLLIIGFITIIVVVIFSLYFARSISQPIRRLKDDVERVGGGELYISAITVKSDEIGSLSASFKEMVDHLRFSFEQIEDKNRQLNDLNKELEAFSYSVSHDLRAPLRSIDGFSKILLEDYDDKLDDQGRDYLHRVRAATLRMSQLIDDMLSLSRITMMSLTPKEFDLSVVVQSAATELARHEPDRKVEWRIKPGVSVRGDEALLRIVVDNLLSNAWKFTSKTGSAVIEFGSRVLNGETVYFIKDNGAGFDIRYVHKLFTPFQRLHSENDYPGTGIGLAIVQRVINRHEGRVWAESEEGNGATFYFTIKL